MDTKKALAQMTDKELTVYRRILAMSSRCLQSQATAELNRRHAQVVEQLLQERGIK